MKRLKIICLFIISGSCVFLNVCKTDAIIGRLRLLNQVLRIYLQQLNDLNNEIDDHIANGGNINGILRNNQLARNIILNNNENIRNLLRNNNNNNRLPRRRNAGS